MNSLAKNFATASAAALLALSLVACGGDDLPACDGETFDTEVAAFCANVVIEGGFECPAGFPFASEFEGGVICSDEMIPRDEIPFEVCEHIGTPEGCGGETPGCEGTPMACESCGEPAGTAICESGRWICPELTVECPCEEGMTAGPACSDCVSDVATPSVCREGEFVCPDGQRFEDQCRADDFPSCAMFGGEVCCGDEGELLGDAYCPSPSQPMCDVGTVAASCEMMGECVDGEHECCDPFGDPTGEAVCPSDGQVCSSGSLCTAGAFAESCHLPDLGLSEFCCDEAGEVTQQGECASFTEDVRCEGYGTPMTTCEPSELSQDDCFTVWQQELIVSVADGLTMPSSESVGFRFEFGIRPEGGLHPFIELVGMDESPIATSDDGPFSPDTHSGEWAELQNPTGATLQTVLGPFGGFVFESAEVTGPMGIIPMCPSSGGNGIRMSNIPDASHLVFFQQAVDGEDGPVIELARFSLR